MEKLRVGFILDDLHPNGYVSDVINFVCEDENFARTPFYNSNRGKDH